jgi:hypothetical protein
MQIWIYDDVQNKSWTDINGLSTIHFAIDNTEPNISIIPSRSPDIGNWYSTRPSYSNTYPTFTISATDTNLEKVEYKWNEETWNEYTGDILYEENGKHILYAKATDLAGNETIEELEVWFDFSNPEGVFTIDDADGIVRQTVKLNFTDVNDPSGSEEINRIEIWIDGSYIEDAAKLSDGVYEYSLSTTELDDGDYTIRPSIFDMAGNRTRPFIKITVDNTSPNISFNLPEDGEIYAGAIDLEATCNEDCDYINFWWWRDDQTIQDAIDNKQNHTININGTSFAWALDSLNPELSNGEIGSELNGVYTFRAAGKDLAGNYHHEEITVTIDNTPPVTSLNEEISGIFTNDPILIVGNTTDNLSGVDFVNLYYKLSSNPEEEWILIGTVPTIDNPDDNSPFAWSYTWTPDAEGTYDIKASATDTLGNEEQSAYIYDLTYDITPPSITIFDIVGDMLNIEVDDVLSGTEKIEIKINDGEWITYISNVNLNDLLNNEPGTYTIYIKVTDKAGNEIEDSTIYTIPEPVAEVLGETDDKSTGGNVVYAQTPGIGSGTEITEETETIPEEEVLGEDILTCENPIQVSGYVYLDKNKNDQMDENEKGIAGISITITGIYKENRITIDTLETDEKGYYKTELCPDTYTLTIDKNDLPKNTEIEEVLSLEIKEDAKEPVEYNIPAIDTRNFWQKYWYLILIAGALGITTVYLITTSRKKEQEY